MPGVLRKPGWPFRACDEAGPHCSLSRSFSARKDRQEAVERRTCEDLELEEELEVKDNEKNECEGNEDKDDLDSCHSFRR